MKTNSAFACLALLCASSLPSISHAISRSSCQAQILDSKKVEAEAADRFKLGEMTRDQVLQARLDTLALRLKCNDILADEYCDTATPAVEDVVKLLKVQVDAGLRPSSDFIAASAQQGQIQDLCM